MDGAGSAYVTGHTGSTDFPTTAGAARRPSPADFDAFVTKLDATGSGLVYSTYLGGSSADFGCGIAVDGAGSAYVTGGTRSTDFPTTAGAAQTTYAGGFDAFVTKLDATGSGLVYSTYLGGSDGDVGFGIAVDGAGSAYVTGVTVSTDFPTTAGAVQTTHAGDIADAFVTKLDATGSGLVYSTYLGGSGSEFGRRHRRGRRGQRLRDGRHELDQFPDDRGGRPDDPRRRFRRLCDEAGRDRIRAGLFDVPGRQRR